MWFLARLYSAQQALDMGLVNTVVRLRSLPFPPVDSSIYYLTAWHEPNERTKLSRRSAPLVPNNLPEQQAARLGWEI